MGVKDPITPQEKLDVISAIGALNVAKNYAEMALRWNDDGTRCDAPRPGFRDEHVNKALEWIEKARQDMIKILK